MSVDGPVRQHMEGQKTSGDGQETGYLAGSKAVDSLDRYETIASDIDSY